MKILTGRFKGRAIDFQPEPGLRPTADKVRKAITDLFAGWIEGRRVLDLYSGTGAFGMELLSAGAQEAVFVEQEPRRAKRIQGWLCEAGLVRETTVLTGDARRAVEKMIKEGRKFDLAIFDPPYEDIESGKLVDRLAGVLSAEAYVIYECRARNRPPDAVGFEKIRDKIYGDTRLVVYRKNPLSC